MFGYAASAGRHALQTASPSSLLTNVHCKLFEIYHSRTSWQNEVGRAERRGAGDHRELTLSVLPALQGMRFSRPGWGSSGSLSATAGGPTDHPPVDALRVMPCPQSGNRRAVLGSCAQGEAQRSRQLRKRNTVDRDEGAHRCYPTLVLHRHARTSMNWQRGATTREPSSIASSRVSLTSD